MATRPCNRPPPLDLGEPSPGQMDWHPVPPAPTGERSFVFPTHLTPLEVEQLNRAMTIMRRGATPSTTLTPRVLAVLWQLNAPQPPQPPVAQRRTDHGMTLALPKGHCNPMADCPPPPGSVQHHAFTARCATSF